MKKENVKIGMKVKVHVPKNKNKIISWMQEEACLIGKEYTVKGITDYCLQVEENFFGFPYEIIKKVKKNKMKKEKVKIGMKVKIIKPKIKDGYVGDVYWPDELDEIVGQEFTIESVNDYSVKLKEYDEFFIPYKALKKVDSDKIRRGDIVCVINNDTVEIDVVTSMILGDNEDCLIPKIGQLGEVIAKAKDDIKKYYLVAFEDETYTVEHSQIIKVYPEKIIL